MDLIKTVSFQAMEELSKTLFQKTQKSSLEQVNKKVADYLVDSGSKKFVEIYNDVASKGDYMRALDLLKID